MNVTTQELLEVLEGILYAGRDGYGVLPDYGEPRDYERNKFRHAVNKLNHMSSGIIVPGMKKCIQFNGASGCVQWWFLSRHDYEMVSNGLALLDRLRFDVGMPPLEHAERLRVSNNNKA